MLESSQSMVDRVVAILGSFSRARSQLGLAEIARLTDLPKSSTHRILQQLVTARWVERVDGDYRLGLGIFEIGSLVAHHNRLVDLARPLMRELSSHRLTTHLAVLDGTDVVYLEKVDGSLAGPLPSRVGGRLPAHCTGVGKTLLAHLPEAELEGYLAHRLEQRTPSTIASPDGLRRELAQIRSAGFGMDHGEAVSGFVCVAAPVFDRSGARAAISVGAPGSRVDPQQLTGPIRHAATALSRRLSAA